MEERYVLNELIVSWCVTNTVGPFYLLVSRTAVVVTQFIKSFCLLALDSTLGCIASVQRQRQSISVLMYDTIAGIFSPAI